VFLTGGLFNQAKYSLEWPEVLTLLANIQGSGPELLFVSYIMLV